MKILLALDIVIVVMILSALGFSSTATPVEKNEASSISNKNVTSLLKDLKDNDSSVRSEAAKALREITDPDVQKSYWTTD